MDHDPYRRCLKHLRAAERYMVAPADGRHLARLSLVIERLKERYETDSAAANAMGSATK